MTTRLTALFPLIVASAAIAQTNRSLVTRALEPAASDLARLNLAVEWRLYLPVENRSDGIATVQPFENQVFVQLQSGGVVAIQAHADPKTFHRPGDILWTYRPLQRPGAIEPLAVGPDEVYVTEGLQLLILDRADGKVKYTEDLVSTASNAPAVDATTVYIPLANRQIVAYSHVETIPGYRPRKPYQAPDPVHHISLQPESADALSTPQNRSPSIARLDILRPPFRRGTDDIDSSPSVGMLRNIRPPYREIDAGRTPSVAKLQNLRDIYDLSRKDSATRIKFLWQLHSNGRLDDSPVLTSDPSDPESQTLTTATGRVIFTAKRQSLRTNSNRTQYMTEAPVTAPLVAQGDSLYVATADSNLIALSMRELREPSMAANSLPRGKFTTGGPIMQKPIVTDDSLYVVGERRGLIRLKRDTLAPLWVERLPDGRIRPKQNPDVVRLLAVSPRTKLDARAGEKQRDVYSSAYVYGLDRQGKLLVIDADRGDTLSSFDVSAFTLPIANERDDRIYIAANSGLLVCMHDRLKVRPVLLQQPPKKAIAPAAEPKNAAAPMKK